MLINVVGPVVVICNQPDRWLAVVPAHLPHYSHAAAVVGSVIILSLIVLMAGASFLWSRRG